MNKVFVSLLLTLGVVTITHAEGNPQAGKDKVVLCSACHGMDGNSPAPNFPKLAGQGEGYLLKQLQDIQAGTAPNAAAGTGRKILEMTGMLANFNAQDLADIAAFYAQQKPTTGFADPNLVVSGEQLFRGGKLEQGMPACTGCHGPNGSGNAPALFPRLAGQHATYLTKQLTDFREGLRTNDGDAQIMRSIAAKLSNKDIEALASYIQGLH
ncbi:cytochrome c553 [Azomonas agilis]|uniref:Cytochrome c553 n=1 Tax=Azomonas agilis TaxID=116849 RepID=A0A562IL44_9GAMM|nr:c-type cytochrome [Azomonas agilis]TWH71324.1 cytochrome c553 [Azomonas agilis]